MTKFRIGADPFSAAVDIGVYIHFHKKPRQSEITHCYTDYNPIAAHVRFCQTS